MSTKRRSTRQRAERQRSVYYEPETEDEYEVDGESEQDDQAQQAPTSTRKKHKVARRSKPQTRSKSKPVGQLGGEEPKRSRKKKHPFTKILFSPKKKTVKEEPPIFSDGRKPEWERLPLEILRDIFIFASQPIHEQTTDAKNNVKWLVRCAKTLGPIFALPALEALYQAPAFHTSLQPYLLLELIKLPKEELYIDYRVKVRRLEIDVKLLAYSAHNRSPFALGSLMIELPRLQHFQIMHPAYLPPFRSVKYQRWNYPPDLFTMIEESGMRLKTWRWNRDMISSDADLYDMITQTHASKSFTYLERLAVCGFDHHGSAEPPPPPENSSAPRLPGLASSISVLPSLKELTFISCDVIMDDFLERIPKNLERLELINCLEITSEILYNYFVVGGSQLRELVLSHNPALDLSFLQNLRALCPRLEVLRMDFTYYSERFNYNDAWAMYDHLLAPGQIPTWPSTLQHLELVNMQKMEAEAAQNLFASLIDNAEDLPKLRYLSLQAHIDIPWRDRAGFRDLWIGRFRKVFLQKLPEPDRRLASMRVFREWKEEQSKSAKAANSDDELPISRRLSHIRVTPHKRPADVAVYSDSEPTPKRRRSARVAESHSASTAAEETESEEEEDDENDSHNGLAQPSFIQGLCSVVDIRIDNQRPRENQYTEANFLDSEPSGDEDWHSGAESNEDGYAW